MTDISLLTKLAAPSSPPPQVPTGHVMLFRDDNWSSQKLDLNIFNIAPGKRQRVESFMFDQATFIAFNLPVGSVMTMMDNTPEAGPNVADLSDCGRCVDLVGTGRTEAVDLRQVNMNDCISAYFWRQVDLDLGAIEVFDDANFSGNRSTIFLSEWAPGTIHPIDKWWLQDRISSVRWRTVSDRETAALFDNSDGSGAQYNNIIGWGEVKEIANFSDIDFNDRASSFRWDNVNPVKEIIAPFDVLIGSVSGSSGLTSVVQGVNNSSVPQPVTVTLNNTDAQTVTVTTTDQHVVGVSTTLSATVGQKDVASVTWSVTLSYSYTHSETNTRSETKTISLSISQTVNAPAMSTYKATLLVNIGQVPPTLYHTTAQRWYDVQVSGAEQDPANNNWWKRVEPVTVSMTGSLASNTTVNMQATPIT